MTTKNKWRLLDDIVRSWVIMKLPMELIYPDDFYISVLAGEVEDINYGDPISQEIEDGKYITPTAENGWIYYMGLKYRLKEEKTK